jgi:pre-60S factor REI1
MIAFESEEVLIEIGQFYDFTSTYSDAGEEDDSDSFDSTTNETGGIKLGAARQATTTTISGDVSAPAADDEGWETDSTLSDVPTDEITAIPLGDRSHRYALLARSRHHSHGDPRPHRSADGWHSHAHTTPVAVYHDEFELHLPSGRTAGHRSLNRYYRQNLRNYPGVAERMELQQQQRRAIASGSESSLDRDAHADGDMGGRGRQLVTRGNGGLGMVGVSEAKKAEIRAVEKRERRREQRERNKYQAGNEKRGNLQKHFRVSPTSLFISLGIIADWFNLQDPLLQ